MTLRHARHLACPLAGAAVTAAGLGPPLHGAAESLFSAHMVQHLLLVVVAAPLFALGSPAIVLARMPRAARTWVRRTAGSLRLLRSVLVATPAAVMIWLAHVGVLWAWHTPALYELALRRPAVHVLEHASLLVTAWAFWAVVFQRRGGRALGLGGVLLYLFAAAGQGTVLGALLTFAEQAWYSPHARTAPAWGVTPLEDQQLAGLVMWIIGGMAYVIPALVIVCGTLQSETRKLPSEDRALSLGQASPPR